MSLTELSSDTPAPPDDGALVQAFVRRHFSWQGTVRLHRASLGADLVRAPVNVALAPIFLCVRLAALVLVRLRLVRVGRWLASRRILLRSDAARAIERALIDDVLRPRLPPGGSLSVSATRLVEDYVGIRSAVAEIVTTLAVLGIGLAVFRAATPGVLSLAPLVSGHAALATAIADFPLGQGLGRVWYGVFPVDPSPMSVVGTALCLVVLASVVTTFAGLLADPVQALLGVHRRRLLALLRRIDRADGAAPDVAPEHILARLADITDAVTALLRLLRP